MIYLDNNASTLMAPEVKEAITELLGESFGNPSSTHLLGRKAKGILVNALERVAKIFHVHPDELIFTSGATEALNMIVDGLASGHVISSAFEHSSVFRSLNRVAARGVPVTFLNPKRGYILLEDVERALQEETRLIVLIGVNNETGLKSEIEKIGVLAKSRGIPFIVDGVAWLGKELFSPIPEGVSAICFSGHKIHGPPGVGLAIVRKGVKIPPFILGGPQQRGRRAGTEDLIGIVGFTKAVELIKNLSPSVIEQMRSLRDRFEEGISNIFPDIVIHGKNEPRISNVSNIAFPGKDGEDLLMKLDLNGVMASVGTACASGGLEPSRILLNMQRPELAASSIRFSLSRYTTPQEIEESIDVFAKIFSSNKT